MHEIHSSEGATYVEIDRQVAADLDTDMSRLRSRIAALGTKNLQLSSDLLALLGPMPLNVLVVDEHELSRATTTAFADLLAPALETSNEIIDLTDTFENAQPAVSSLCETAAAAVPAILDLSTVLYATPRTLQLCSASGLAVRATQEAWSVRAA